MSLRPTWTTQCVLGQVGLKNETLHKTTKPPKRGGQAISGKANEPVWRLGPTWCEEIIHVYSRPLPSVCVAACLHR